MVNFYTNGSPAGGAPPEPPTVEIISRTVVRPYAIIMAAVLPDLAQHFITVGFSDGNRYERQQRPVELAGQTLAQPLGVGNSVTIRGFIETTTPPQLTWGVAWTASITLTPLPGGGAPGSSPIVVATDAVLATDTEFRATFDKSTIPEGWYLAGVTGQPAPWDVLQYPMYVRHSNTAQTQTHTPVCVASWTHEHTSRHAYAMVPAQFDPIEVPLATRTYPTIATIANASPASNEMARFAYTMLVPCKIDDVYRPNVLPSGVWTTCNTQNYFFSHYELAKPLWALLDGPRGRGNLACPTSLRESQRPTGGKVLFTDPWRVGTVDDDGTVHTEAGYIHDEPPPYANNSSFVQQRPLAPVRLVGDWSAVPTNLQGFWELWDVAVDYRSTTLDNTVPPIGTPPEQPHPSAVMKYVTDTKRNRVCKLTYAGNDLTRTAAVTEFVTGLTAPWGCETYGNLLLVTESGGTPQTATGYVRAYDMGTYDATTGALISGTPGQLMWSVFLPRAEGIRVMDDVAYIGSFASKAIWKLNLLDPTAPASLTKFVDILYDANARFVNIAVSDGTFGPRGSVAYSTWSSLHYGWPVMVSPTGVRLQVGDRENFGFGEPKGMYAPDGLSYGSAVSIGKGRMTFGTVQDGLHRISGALGTDATVSNSVLTGVQKWYDRDYDLVWSDFGFGLYGVPLPWGLDSDIDAMLTNMGHT